MIYYHVTSLPEYFRDGGRFGWGCHFRIRTPWTTPSTRIISCSSLARMDASSISHYRARERLLMGNFHWRWWREDSVQVFVAVRQSYYCLLEIFAAMSKEFSSWFRRWGRDKNGRVIENLELWSTVVFFFSSDGSRSGKGYEFTIV